MRRYGSIRQISLFVFIGAGLGAGCGGPPTIALVPVSGKVTIDGKPVTAGQVSLTAVDEKAGGGLCTGPISADGEYKIFTDGKPGAPLGKYKATVTPPMVPPTGGGAPPPPPYNASYSNPKATPLPVLEVVSSPAAGAYDLKLKK